MEYQIEENERSLTPDQIREMCRRGFGNHPNLESIRELGGGTFNTTYLITFADQRKVILRVSPPKTADILWDEAFLMRREHTVQPFFAPVAALMSKTLLVDFTHQLIDRDYMFQSYIEGERWDVIMDELTPEENNNLWGQFGEILSRIHHVQGEKFGLPLPGFQFSSWSETVMNRFERTLQAAQDKSIEIPYLESIREEIGTHPQQLDEIQVPRLLHGDLWLFNILITRQANEPSIIGILDADRAWWGDPRADWTMFILAHSENKEGYSRFWQAYGQPADTSGAKFRANVYDAMHAITAFIWASQHKDDETLVRAQGTLGEVVASLPHLV